MQLSLPIRRALVIAAIQEELGLKPESRKLQLDVMIIDHIEAPAAN